MSKVKITRITFLLSLVFIQACRQSKEKAAITDSTKPKVDLFAEHVRSTAFKTPEQEKAGFTLPEGFEITLFASEPDIGKPINMEFDDKGRLWVTQSSEYPMAAPPAKGHDKITILEDTDGDGKADKFSPFAQDLDIPIGITPYKDGAIAYSIPNVYLFSDKDSDGIADNRKKLLGPFGFRDTHGMVSNLIRGFDGWIHSCHGFTNTSTVAGTDGDSITMTSGNTFRFRPDGSRVEQTTFGRVNPFGYAFDEWGYLYSVDCHSKPIYQLIKGAEYPHFGKRAPAMGFAPEMMSYELGSTALSGLVYYTGEQYPSTYKHTFFNGDVVTCRINRNSIDYNGASPESKKEKDFLISADPWFRPVDLKTGPDGSIYVADFYNRIIGHYEVPLDHPGRDHKSGRIWKITYKGKDAGKQMPVKDWAKLSLDSLVTALNYPQLNIRMNIANLLVDKYGQKAIAPVKNMMLSPGADSLSFIQGLWILYRLNALPQDIISKALQHNNPMIEVHALRILGEMKSISAGSYKLVLAALQNANPNVQRIAVEVLSHTPSIINIKPLLQVYQKAGEKDTHLKYTALISIRDNLKSDRVLQQFSSVNWTEPELSILIKTMPDVPFERAASLTLGYLQHHEIDQAQMLTYLEYISRYISASRFDDAIAIIKTKYAGDADTQYNLYRKMREGLAQKGVTVSPKMKEWGIDLAQLFLKTAGDENITWINTPFPQIAESEDPWKVSNNFTIGSHPGFKIMLSENNWYGPTGTVRSPSFVLPATLQMNLFDNEIHNRDIKKGTSNNIMRVRLEKNKSVVAEYRASFDTVPTFEQLVVVKKFEFGNNKGEKAYIELVDSTHSGSIGVGAFEPSVIIVPDKGSGQVATQQIQAAEIAADYHAKALEPGLLTLVNTKWTAQKARSAAADALITLSSNNSATLLQVFSNPEEPSALREKIATALGRYPSSAIYDAMVKALQGGTRNLRIVIAAVLSAAPQGIDYLLQAIKSGDLPVDILDEIPVKEKLAVNIKPAQQQSLASLTKGKNGNQDRRTLIQARLKNFDSAAVTVSAGKNIFMQNCSMCHQIKGNGGMIGPQLDGIGNWGQKALTEKILDPNRNISQAFRVFNITLNDGKQMGGLFRREEGALVIFANPGGQEFSVPKKDIKEKTPSKYTLMPDQFRNVIPEKDFYALMKYLLSVK